MRANPGLYIALLIGIAGAILYLSNFVGGSLLNTDLGSGVPGQSVRYPETRPNQSAQPFQSNQSAQPAGESTSSGFCPDDKMTLVTGAGLAVGFLVFGNMGRWLRDRKRKKFQSYMEKQFKDSHR